MKLGYLDTTYVFSGEVKTLSCYLLVWSNHYETFVRTIFLKLCQRDNLLQSRETLKLLLIKINFTFSGIHWFNKFLENLITFHLLRKLFFVGFQATLTFVVTNLLIWKLNLLYHYRLPTWKFLILISNQTSINMSWTNVSRFGKNKLEINYMNWSQILPANVHS